MGAYLLPYSGQLTQPLYDIEYHYTREPAPPSVKKHDVLLARLYIHVGALFKIEAYMVHGDIRYGNHALLAALSPHNDVTLVEKQVRQVEIDQFAHAQSAAVESFHNGKIALPLGRAKVDTRLHCVDLVDGQHSGR